MAGKKMTALELAAEWENLAHQERERRIYAEDLAETYRLDLRRAEEELYRPSLWTRIKDRVLG